jgi:hypothetical protein
MARMRRGAYVQLLQASGRASGTGACSRSEWPVKRMCKRPAGGLGIPTRAPALRDGMRVRQTRPRERLSASIISHTFRR